MKKIKIFTFSLLAIAFTAIGLYSCSNEETLQSNHESAEQISNLQSRSDGSTHIGNIENGAAIPLYDKDLLKANLVLNGLFAEIESIDLDYGYDSENNQDIAILTMIGKNTNDFSLEAFQAELIVDGNILILPDPTNPDLPVTTFAKHSCAGAPCNSCAFTRTGFLNLKITGCKCNEKKEGTRCNHGINGGASTKEIVDTVVDTVL